MFSALGCQAQLFVPEGESPSMRRLQQATASEARADSLAQSKIDKGMKVIFFLVMRCQRDFLAIDIANQHLLTT